MIFIPILALLNAILTLPLFILPSSAGFDFSTFMQIRHIMGFVYWFNFYFPIDTLFYLLSLYIKLMLVFLIAYLVLYIVRLIRGN